MFIGGASEGSAAVLDEGIGVPGCCLGNGAL
jgi:hypothetical protein